MYILIKNFHFFSAFFLVLFLIFAIGFNGYSWLRKKPFTANNKVFALFALASMHIQVLIGFILYFFSPLGYSNVSSAAMKDSHSRFYMLEHPLVMIIALLLVTIAYVKAMRLTNDNAKYKKIVRRC